MPVINGAENCASVFNSPLAEILYRHDLSPAQFANAIHSESTMMPAMETLIALAQKQHC